MKRSLPGTCRLSGKVRRWLKANCPDDSGACMIHNDWRFDNVLLDPQDPTKVIGVLDLELPPWAIRLSTWAACWPTG